MFRSVVGVNVDVVRVNPLCWITSKLMELSSEVSKRALRRLRVWWLWAIIDLETDTLVSVSSFFWGDGENNLSVFAILTTPFVFVKFAIFWIVVVSREI